MKETMSLDSKLVLAGLAGALFGASAAGLALAVAKRDGIYTIDFDTNNDEDDDDDNSSPLPSLVRTGFTPSVSFSPLDGAPHLISSASHSLDLPASSLAQVRVESPSDAVERVSGTDEDARLEVEDATAEEDDPKDDRRKDEERILLNLLYSIAEDQARREGVVHRGIICNVCQRSPVLGVRFKCANCLDYDICEACEPKDNHDSSHVFVKIRVPLPPLASPRKVLFPPLYVGRRRGNVAPAAAIGLSGSGEAYQPLSWHQLQDLVKETQFDHYELESLHEQYYRLCSRPSLNEAAPPGISRTNFNDCLGSLNIGGNLVVSRLFDFYDRNADGFIDFGEMSRGLSVLIKGSLPDKLPHVFRGYDLDNVGTVSKDNLRQMFKAYFGLTVELVKDVVRSCEEDMFNSHFDDGSGKPVSTLFTAPIPAELGYPPPASETAGVDSTANDSGFPRFDSATISRSNSGIPSSLSALYLSPTSPHPLIGGGGGRGIFHDFRTPSDAPRILATPTTGACRGFGERARLVSTPNESVRTAEENNRADPSDDSQKSGDNNDGEREANAVAEDRTQASEGVSERRYAPMWPVIEAMSQDAMAELVDSFFANANVADGDRMTYEQFFFLSQSDRSLLAWFEALGTVF